MKNFKLFLALLAVSTVTMADDVAPATIPATDVKNEVVAPKADEAKDDAKKDEVVAPKANEAKDDTKKDVSTSATDKKDEAKDDAKKDVPASTTSWSDTFKAPFTTINGWFKSVDKAVLGAFNEYQAEMKDGKAGELSYVKQAYNEVVCNPTRTVVVTAALYASFVAYNQCKDTNCKKSNSKN